MSFGIKFRISFVSIGSTLSYPFFMKYLTFWVLWLGLGGYLWAQPNNPVIQKFEAERIYARGLAHYQAGEYTQAIDLFQRVVELDKTHPEVYEFRAESNYALGKYREAIADYEEALRQQPRDVELLNSVGVSLGQLEMYTTAIKYFDRALTIDSTHREARHNREEAMRRQGLMAQNNQPYARAGKDPFANPGGGGNNAPSIIDLQAFSLVKVSKGISPFEKPKEKRFQKAKPKETTYRERDIRFSNISDPGVTVLRVITRERETEVSLLIRNLSNQTYPLRLGRAGTDEAFFLSDVRLNRLYPLRDVRGLQGWRQGKPYGMLKGESKVVALIFAPLDAGVEIVHLLEGKTNRPGTWDFWHVQLQQTP